MEQGKKRIFRASTNIFYVFFRFEQLNGHVSDSCISFLANKAIQTLTNIEASTKLRLKKTMKHQLTLTV